MAISNGRNLLPEMVAEILSWLPVKTLGRFKLLSPSFQTLISSPHFAKTHLLNRTKNNPKLQIILISTSHALYSVDLSDDVPTARKLDFQQSDESVEVLSSCNGLLLVSHGRRDGENCNFLLNPTTRECKKLPKLPFALYSSSGYYLYLYGVGCDLSSGDYKVVMLSYYGTTSESESEFATTDDPNIDTTIVAVYSMKTNTWRRIRDTHYVPSDATPGVYFNGCLHWICCRTGGLDCPYVVVAFDLKHEIFREVPLPASFHDYEVTYYEVEVLGECLCLVARRSSHQTEVWMMMAYGVKESWTKYMIEMPEGTWVKLFTLLAEDEFLLKTQLVTEDGVDQKKLVVYNPKKGATRDMVVGGLPTEFTFGGTYVESPISPSPGRLERLEDY